jgi:hypothetical protein
MLKFPAWLFQPFSYYNPVKPGEFKHADYNVRWINNKGLWLLYTLHLYILVILARSSCLIIPDPWLH